MVKLTREFYRPLNKGAVKYIPKDVVAELYSYEVTNHYGITHYVLMAFGGKRSKPDLHYSYPTQEAREKAALEYLNNLRLHAEFKEEQRAKRNKTHTLKVGALLYSSWGYDQTNVDFYLVVELVGKTMVKIEEIGQKIAGANAMVEYVSPDPSIRTGNFLRKKVNGENNSISLTSYSSAYPTTLDAKHYQTPFGYGH